MRELIFQEKCLWMVRLWFGAGLKAYLSWKSN